MVFHFSYHVLTVLGLTFQLSSVAVVVTIPWADERSVRSGQVADVTAHEYRRSKRERVGTAENRSGDEASRRDQSMRHLVADVLSAGDLSGISKFFAQEESHKVEARDRHLIASTRT